MRARPDAHLCRRATGRRCSSCGCRPPLPFIFNALKINSTLALIGAIVAEFFGTPIVGMGFRISTEVGRMNLDMVWAEIAVAAVAGSVVLRPGRARSSAPSRSGIRPVRGADEARQTGREWTMKKLIAGPPRSRRSVARPASAQAADKVTLQLKWVTQAQFAGYYVAKDKGFYEEDGLDVDDQAGRPGHRPAAGDRRRRRRRDHRLDALGAGHAARRACRWSTSPSRSRAPA